jgi:hypothetical protein
MSGEDGQIKDINEAFKPYISSLYEAAEELITIASSEFVAVA